jgi:hypothetical protein
VSLVHACFNLLIVLSQVYSYLEFDLTLGVIPSDWIATSCSPYLYMFYSVLLAPRLIVLSPGLLFRSMKSCLVLSPGLLFRSMKGITYSSSSEDGDSDEEVSKKGRKGRNKHDKYSYNTMSFNCNNMHSSTTYTSVPVSKAPWFDGMNYN